MAFGIHELATKAKHVIMKHTVPFFDGIRYVPLEDVTSREGGEHAFPDEDAIWLFPKDRATGTETETRGVTLVQNTRKGEVRREFREYVPDANLTKNVTLYVR